MAASVALGLSFYYYSRRPGVPWRIVRPRQVFGASKFVLKERLGELSISNDRTRLVLGVPTIGRLRMVGAATAPRTFRTGDRTFDALIVVDASPRELARPFLDAEMRSAIATLRRLGNGSFSWPGLDVEASEGRIIFEISRMVSVRRGELGEFLRLASLIANRYAAVVESFPGARAPVGY